MSAGSGGRPLPPELEAVVARVLDEADLRFVDGARDVERELRAHFEDGLARGESPEDLIRRFGDPAAAGRHIARTRPGAEAKNRGETGRWWMSATEWWNEVRMAGRRLRRAPAFAAVVVLTLALGVGANTAIFTVLHAVILQDLPYPEPDRLVRVYETSVEDPDLEYIRAPVLTEWMTWDEVFEGLGSIYTYREDGADLTGGAAPRRVILTRVGFGYFEALGTRPLLGRTFTRDESFGGGGDVSTSTPAAQVAVISHRLWAAEFGSEPNVIGRSLELDGVSFEIVGVMPRDFENPIGSPAEVWVPQDLRTGGSNSFGNYYLSAVGRLREGVSVASAQDRVRALATGFFEQEPGVRGSYPAIVPLQGDVVGATRRSMLLILAGAAALVLLTACVNVANLLFARGLAQDRGLALRSALGSARSRLVAGILVENGLLAAAGGVLGFGLGWLGLRALLRVAPEALPASASVELGLPIFGFALGVTALALLVFGLTPALRMSRTAPADVLRSGDRSSTLGRAAGRVRNALVVVQVAAALVLVAGATLLTRSFGALVDVPLGLEPEGVLTFEVHLPTARYPDREARDAFHERLHERLAALPGVESAGATSWLPVNGRYHIWGIYWDPEDPEGDRDERWFSSDVRVISGDHFEAMGIDLLAGVPPSQVDFEAELVVWINQSIAREVFGDVDPIGKLVRVSGGPRRVMGVVEDVPHHPRGDLNRTSYVPHAQADGRNWALVQTVEASGDLSGVLERARSELASLDPELVLFRPRTFEAHLDVVRAQDRFALLLMGAFAGLALVLSLVGTYGVLAGSVAGRTREIGIRMALGADAGTVRSMVLRYAAALTLPGIVLGLGGAWLGSRWIETLLFGVEPADPVALAASVTVFLAVGLVAAWLPAERATRVDTMHALGAE